MQHFDGETFESVEQFVFFIGWGRSGHSLIGSLIDAHPDAVVAHEQDVFQLVGRGLSLEKTFYFILANSWAFSKIGRGWSGYSYEVPGQWQGRYRTLKVIGDKKGGVTSVRLKKNPELLDRLRDKPFGSTMVLVTRNPFDNIATMARRQAHRDPRLPSTALASDTPARFVVEAANHYLSICETCRDLQKADTPCSLYSLRYESFVEDPRGQLAALCRALGLEPDDAYLNACASLVKPTAHRSRDQIDWPAETKELIELEIVKFPFLDGYTFES